MRIPEDCSSDQLSAGPAAAVQTSAAGVGPGACGGGADGSVDRAEGGHADVGAEVHVAGEVDENGESETGACVDAGIDVEVSAEVGSADVGIGVGPDVAGPDTGRSDAVSAVASAVMLVGRSGAVASITAERSSTTAVTGTSAADPDSGGGPSGTA